MPSRPTSGLTWACIPIILGLVLLLIAIGGPILSTGAHLE